ncbi:MULTISPECIES: SRPBCC family protein [unclassified Knoellia]|uniref:SRPBCC family protein n=1 Tax=Knoellia altitudinis TaxID=3404795 RepID=UPI00361C0B00
MSTKVEKSIVVDVPISTAYNQWTQFEDFPQFMGAVQQVEQLDDQRLRWVAQIAGVKREWEARILEQRPDEKIAWAATEGATNAGAVYFAPVGAGQTRVTLELEYEPEGLVEKAGETLSIVERQAEKDVESFKTFIEGRSTPTGAWRGDVEGAVPGTPGVESATSQGDSGKAGISKTAMAAGAAAVAAGAAAVAATRGGGSGEDSQSSQDSPAEAEVVAPVTEDETFVSEPVVAEAVVVEAVVVDEDTLTDPRANI